MKVFLGCFVLSIFWTSAVFGQKISNIKMVDAVTNQEYTLEKNKSAKAQVFIFYTLKCPYSKLYNSRIKALKEKYTAANITFALVNPLAGQESETQEKLSNLSFAKDNKLPYLMDDQQVFTKMTEVKKIPEVVIITSGPTGYSIAYRGAIDNNAQAMQSATVHHLSAALDDLINKDRPSPTVTRAVGCNIKY
ncbi:thioredoxin-like domain-containing protein [uncultured Cyclobacterium sp.]|uniref:redoxin family protein n=1 Tax=uncultured Cyclobacterium sp. TaxID=453820 RepID=UPI0030EB99DE